MGDVIVSMEHLTKEFPGVKALDDVKFNLRSGEVMALLGENGAGKSTLMKILSGGKGKITGTLLGLAFLGVIQNAMTLMGVDNYIQYIVEGALVLIAVLFNTLQTRKSE